LLRIEGLGRNYCATRWKTLKKKSAYYIDPEAFERDLAEYKAGLCAQLLNRICAVYFYPLAHEVLKTLGPGYADPDDCIQEAVEKCVDRVDRYTRANGKPFSFFSVVVKNKIKDCKRKAYRKAGDKSLSLDQSEGLIDRLSVRIHQSRETEIIKTRRPFSC